MELVDEGEDLAPMQESEIYGFERFSAMATMNRVHFHRVQCETPQFDHKMEDVEAHIMDISPETEASVGLIPIGDTNGDIVNQEAQDVMDCCQSSFVAFPKCVDAKVELVSNKNPSTNKVDDLDSASEESAVNSERSDLIKLSDICGICQEFEKCHLRAVGYFHTKSAVYPTEEHVSPCDDVSEESLNVSHHNAVNCEGSNLIKLSDICEICQEFERCHLRAVGYFHRKSAVYPTEEHVSPCDDVSEESLDVSHHNAVNCEGSDRIKLSDICEICQEFEKCHLRAVSYFHRKSAVYPTEEHVSPCYDVSEESLDVSHHNAVNSERSDLIKLSDICGICQEFEKCHLRAVGYFRTKSAVRSTREHHWTSGTKK